MEFSYSSPTLLLLLKHQSLLWDGSSACLCPLEQPYLGEGSAAASDGDLTACKQLFPMSPNLILTRRRASCPNLIGEETEAQR